MRTGGAIRHRAAVAGLTTTGLTTASSAATRHVVPTEIDPAAVRPPPAGHAVLDLAGGTMGTAWHVRLVAPARRAALLRQAVQDRLDLIEAELSHWRPGTPLSRFNAAPPDSWRALPPDFAAVIATGLAIAGQSGGAFDPACGRLTDLWGLGSNPRSDPPDADALATALAGSGWNRLTFDAGARRLCQPGGAWLDLSGIAKGHAADRVADLLVQAGIGHALVGIGGEYVGRGLRPDGDPWWVELETPPSLALPPMRVAACGLAVATSGDQVRGLHTIDPRTGRPVHDALISVSVVHPRCIVADAWATALVVLGAAAYPVAEAAGLATRIVTRDGEEWISPALQAMID